MKLALLLAFAATLVFAQAPPPKAPATPPAKAEAAKPAPAKAITPIGVGFVGNKDSKIFHRPDCKSVGKMKDKNKTTFASKADAEKAGFKACKTCKP